MSQVKQVLQWNIDAGNTSDVVNVRQSAVYFGMQVEELAEKFMAIGIKNTGTILDQLATDIKSGLYDDKIERALLSEEGREAMLDADIDQIVVSIGAAMSQGADVLGAFSEVVRSNDSKRTDGVIQKDANGKIIKPAHYSPANLKPYISTVAEVLAKQG